MAIRVAKEAEVSKKNTEIAGGSKEIEDGVGVVKKNVSGCGLISCNVKGRNLNVVTCVCSGKCRAAVSRGGNH